MRRKTHNIAGFKVNANRCSSCPFNEHGCQSTRSMVQERCLKRGSQMCHSTKDTTLCRGARDFQLQIFHRMGWLKEPTDKCWIETMKELGIEK